ncbi:MAG TPA: glycosyl hydrolase family 65 protein [Thermoleophilia bacterium]|nr:glycosyl hydrolase family 65 protein [Thermoleophilia bacterium]
MPTGGDNTRRVRARTHEPRLERALARRFPVICFAWDGTAVARREADASAVRSRVERLTALGVDIAVISSAHVTEVDEQLRARPGVEGRLFLYLSRGSEVYVVGPAGPRLLERRQSTPLEKELLVGIAEALRDRLAAAGLHVELVRHHLNRRSVDLIPDWPEPPGAEVEELQRQVEARLRDAGFAGGLKECMEIARQLGRDAGLPEPAVTSDVRHIDIGLTGKGDAMHAVSRALVAGRGRQPQDLLVLGDTFGPVADGQGTDSAMLIPELRRAVYVSVGAEAFGVPPQVLHAGGGPVSFLDILHDQLAMWEIVAQRSFPEPTGDPAWRFEVKGFDPFREREVETWLTVANGETGTRGALEEGSAISTPATFVAGVYGDGTGDPPFRQPVPAPDWTGLRLMVAGSAMTLSNGEIIDHERVLDLRHGVVYRTWRQRLRSGRTVRVRTARFASLADRQLMALRAEATPEDFSGAIVWQSAIGVTHAGGPTRETAFEILDDPPGMIARTRGRNGGGHVLAVTTNPAPGSPVARTPQQARDVIGGRLEPGDPATVDRLASIVSARTKVPSADVARRALERARRTGYDELLRRHQAAWDAAWDAADLRVDGDAEDQHALRFAIYHMISTAHPGKDTVSIGARGLGGMSYFLHVFWDTEIFVLPFFIYTQPETALTMLKYRYRNLAGAREKAARMGFRGALYPWESADKGVETTPPYGYGPSGEQVPILSGLMEHHISADVAWAVWEYWKATGDDAFMASMGVEMLLETARFWVSRAASDRQGRYHVRVVVGPDEYHEGVDDNAYTNVLARWNIKRALEALAWLEGVDRDRAVELKKRLGTTGSELSTWRRVLDGYVTGFDPETLLYEQFAGFYDMADVPIEKLRPRPMAADLLLGRDVTLVSKVVKQADVVMLCHVLADEIDEATTRANYDYYEPITCHGSSLSPGIHAAVAARLHDIPEATEYFKMAAAIDLADNMGNAAAGLHMATMGGLWQAAVMGFCGIMRRGEALRLDPQLPEAWKRVRMPLRFRGARLSLDLRARKDGVDVGITVENAPVTLQLDGVEREFPPGRHRLRRRGGGPWQVEAG